MHSHLIFIVVAVLGGLHVLYWIYTSITAPDRKVPGPFLARLSKLWYLQKLRTGSFHHENIKLHQKYGPVIRVAPGYFSITTPDPAAYGISSKFIKGDWYQGWQHPSPTRFTLFTDQDRKRHAENRKVFQGLYSRSSLLSYEGYVDDCVNIFLQRLREFSKSGETIDLSHWLQCYAFDVIGEITYSERFGFLDSGEDVAGTMAALDRSMVYSTLVGVYSWLHPTLYAINEKLPNTGAAGRTYLMNFTGKKIEERKSARKEGSHAATSEEKDSSTPRDFLDKLADANEENAEKVTPYHIFMMGISNIIAGSDTTAVSLSSIMFRLITNPETLKKLRQEVFEHRIKGTNFTFKQTQDMPYLQAVIKESLRMHSATGLPLWRVVPEGGAEVAGQFFPAGTNIGINTWVAHYDKDVYGEDVNDFRPERWIEGKEEGGERLQRMEANFMPVSTY